VAVAELLHEEGYPETVVAAALLHDVIEDTATDLDEIADLYGREVAFLVGEMTEDERLEPYGHRKAEHRLRVARTGPVAAIYAADKIASLRALDSGDHRPAGARLGHYRRTLEILCAEHPDLPFLMELRRRLDELG
jgi:(p)ppGpp synthase/HD superfamily hydrolase